MTKNIRHYFGDTNVFRRRSSAKGKSQCSSYVNSHFAATFTDHHEMGKERKKAKTHIHIERQKLYTMGCLLGCLSHTKPADNNHCKTYDVISMTFLLKSFKQLCFCLFVWFYTGLSFDNVCHAIIFAQIKKHNTKIVFVKYIAFQMCIVSFGVQYGMHNLFVCIYQVLKEG